MKNFGMQFTKINLIKKNLFVCLILILFIVEYIKINNKNTVEWPSHFSRFFTTTATMVEKKRLINYIFVLISFLFLSLAFTFVLIYDFILQCVLLIDKQLTNCESEKCILCLI